MAMLLESCTVWRAQRRPVAEMLAARHESSVRVNHSVVIYDPAVKGDSLVGTLRHMRGREDVQPAALPLSDVHSVDVQRVSIARTVGLVAALAVTVVVIEVILHPPGSLFGPGDGPIITLTR